jgi:hypothetical protein
MQTQTQPPGYEELAHDGTNYPAWATDIKIVLASKGILNAISAPQLNEEPIDDKTKFTALLLLRQSIHPDLKREYLLEENPQTLWNALKERYEHQKELVLPTAEHEWNHLRLQDFKSIGEYNHAVHNICTKLRFCEKEPSDEEKIRKTLNTMHPADRVLCNQYRKENHIVYAKLIHSLDQAERNDELLLKNHHMRPIGATPLPEVHNVQNKASRHKKTFAFPPGNQKNSTSGQHRNRVFHKNHKQHVHKKVRGDKQSHGNKPKHCYKCGCNTHFAATCRTPKHLVDLYMKYSKESKNKKTRYEAHFNQANEENKQDGCSLEIPKESPTNNVPTQPENLLDDMIVDYNVNDMI